MKKRIIAVILTVLMIMAVCPVMMAEDGEDSSENYIRPVFFDNAAKYLEPITEQAVPAIATWGLKGRAAEPEESKTIVKKEAKDNGDGSFTLTLESYATGSLETNSKKIPADIVLVLDESGSMDNCMICGANPATEGKINYAEIYAGNMDPSKVDEYYYEADGTYYLATYCDKEGCGMYGKWLQNSNDHKDGGNHSKGSERKPKTSSSSSGYQYYVIEHICTQRVTALKSAVNSFLESVYDDADGADNVFGTNDDTRHRVAIVSYGNAYDSAIAAADQPIRLESYVSGSESSDPYDNPSGNSLGYAYSPNLSLDRYKRLFRNVVYENERTRLNKIVSSKIGKSGDTATEEGLHAALGAFQNSEIPLTIDENGRNRVVILFTDGAPTHGGGNTNYFVKADDAVGYAHTIKDRYDATIFTVGIFSGADASNPGSLPQYYEPGTIALNPDSTGENQAIRGRGMANRFMHLISSNYPEATAMNDDSTGELNKNLSGDSYYLSAGDSDELSQVFQKIYESISSSSSELTEESIVKDIVEDSFYIPDVEGATAVRAYSMEYKGDELWEKKDDYIAEVNGREVTVTGFNFQEKWVGYVVNDDISVPHGEKLVIEIDIRPNPDFLGGDNVFTNKEGSGIYINDKAEKPVAEFISPTVNVDVKEMIPAFKDGKIYVSQQAELPHIANIGKFYIGDPETDPQEIDGINNEYVRIVYTITENKANGKSTTLTINPGMTLDEALNECEWEDEELMIKHALTEDDSLYTVECDVISKNNEANHKPVSRTQTIHVYKPVITFKDSEMNLGDPVPNHNEVNFVDVIWQHTYTEDVDGEIVTIVEDADEDEMGAPPTLEYTYTPVEGNFTQDTPVKVTVKTVADDDREDHVVTEMYITDYTTFYREACTFDGCAHNAEEAAKPILGTNAERTNFIVHINTFSLTIVKKGNISLDHDSDESQSFIFEVKKGDDHLMNVVINGTGSTTITNLPVGKYTVTELENWSWRYNAKGDASKTVDTSDKTIEIVDGVITVTFENDRTETKWLSGDSFAKNLWESGATGIVDNTAGSQGN